MRLTSRVAGIAFLACGGLDMGGLRAPASEAPSVTPPPVLTVRVIGPDRQLDRLLDLFDGARAAHPAEALAAWRRATGLHDGLGKSLQALIALLNPEMVAELRILRDATFRMGLDTAGPEIPDEATAWWSLVLPGDDGSIGAVGVALALTDGAAEPRLQDASVDRLGPPGSPLLGHDRTGRGVALASDPRRLVDALEQLRETPNAAEGDPARPGIADGWFATLDVGALEAGMSATTGPLWARRLVAVLPVFDCRRVEVAGGLCDDDLDVVVTGHDQGPNAVPLEATVEPSWLDWIPVDRTLAAVAFALDEAGLAWGKAFEIADRIERVDPARAEAAPLRARIGLMALASGVRLEVDLRPSLRGITACVTTDRDGTLDGGLIVLHARNETSARRIVDRVVRPIANRFGISGGQAGDGANHGRIRLGRASGRPVDLAIRGTTVVVAWGEGVLDASLDAQEQPTRSAGPILLAHAANNSRLQRVGAFWPGRWRYGDLDPAGAPWSRALVGSSPVVWVGSGWGATCRDLIRWSDLRGPVRRFLEDLPMDLAGRPAALDGTARLSAPLDHP